MGGRAHGVVHNLTSRLDSLGANLLVLDSALLVVNRVAFLFKDSLALLLPLSGADLLLMCVAHVFVHSCALLLLGRLTMLFGNSATHRMWD